MNQNKNSLFWKLHLSWWAIDTAYATLPTYKLPEGSPTTIFFFYVLHYGSMVGLTYLYRVIYRKINPNEENHYLQFIAPIIGVVLVGTVFFLINSHDFIYHYKFWETQPYTPERRWAYWVDCIWDTLPWFMGYHLFKYSRISTERESGLLKSLHDSELDRLRKQLNPHFLFNALNGIRALVLTEPTQSREAIGQLSDLLRLSLKTKLDKNIPLSVEVEILENYLSIEKLRFHDRLTIEINIPNDLKNYKVLPFCLQILAENAIKHGIGKHKKGGVIKVSGEKNNNNLILKVMNMGSINQEPDFLDESTGIGLENLAKRLKINFGEKATFTISEKDKWVTAMVVLPLES
jgi:two-component system, LytTR family, sensor kinase